MKVAHINGVYGIASTGRLIHDIVETGEKEGVISRVYYSEAHSDAPEAVRYITDLQRNAHSLASRITGLQGYWSKASTKALIAMLDEFKPDVVHLHVVHGNCLHLPTLFTWLRERQPAVVITLHDCWWFTGRCVYPTFYDCKGYQRGCGHCPAKRDICPSWFFDRAEKMLADKKEWLLGLQSLKVVAVSDWVREQAQRSFLPEQSILRIYNWVDTETFYPRQADELRQKLSLNGEKIILGIASQWSEMKGLPDFLRLAALLPGGYRIVLVGKLPDNMTLPENIISLPPTNSCEELAAYYSMADVFVNPSRCETFGLTTAEAMACGTPAVVYDVTACPELIGPGTGAVVPFRKGGETILRTVQSIRKTPETEDACQNWVKQHFSVSTCTEQYYKLYCRGVS